MCITKYEHVFHRDYTRTKFYTDDLNTGVLFMIECTTSGIIYSIQLQPAGEYHKKKKFKKLLQNILLPLGCCELQSLQDRSMHLGSCAILYLEMSGLHDAWVQVHTGTYRALGID